MTRIDLDQLRRWDAADTNLSTSQRARAEQLLHRILAGEQASVPRVPRSTAHRRRHVRRAAGMATAAAAVTTSYVAIAGHGGTAVAYASWTAAPASVSTQDLSVATRACRADLRRYTSGPGKIGFDAATIPPVLAERRGDYVAVLFRLRDGQASAPCVVRNVAGSAQVTDINTAAGGGTGPVPVLPAGRFDEESVAQIGDPPFSFLDGRVGPGVRELTIHVNGRTITATIAQGQYAAWWPGTAFTPTRQSSGRGGPNEVMTYDTTLNNNTVTTNAAPWRGK